MAEESYKEESPNSEVPYDISDHHHQRTNRSFRPGFHGYLRRLRQSHAHEEQLPVEQLPVEQLPVEQLPLEQLLGDLRSRDSRTVLAICRVAYTTRHGAHDVGAHNNRPTIQRPFEREHCSPDRLLPRPIALPTDCSPD